MQTCAKFRLVSHTPPKTTVTRGGGGGGMQNEGPLFLNISNSSPLIKNIYIYFKTEMLYYSVSDTGIIRKRKSEC